MRLATLLGVLVVVTAFLGDARAAEISGQQRAQAAGRLLLGTPAPRLILKTIDGDTIDIAGTRIRLQGIDAPESDQTCTDSRNGAWRCGRAATRALIGFIAGRPLRCETSGFDRYRRVLAMCALPDDTDANAWMVQQGWALTYYAATYQPQEAEARAAKRGIWAGSFIPPWEWRHRHLH